MEHNKIHLGDAYDLIKQIPDKSIDLIYTDPPYKFGSFGERNHMIKETTKSQVKEISNGINNDILKEFVRVMKNIHIYIWCNDKQIIDYMNFFVNELKCDYMILGWIKSNPMPMFNKRMLDDVEYCLVFTDKQAKKFKGVCSYENSFKFYQEPINLTDKKDYGHPTIKPLRCVKNHLEKATNENDLVLDPFMGSGTTAVACKELGRNFIGFEINEKYHKIAVDRLNGIKKNGQMSLFDTDFEQLSLFNNGEKNEY